MSRIAPAGANDTVMCGSVFSGLDLLGLGIMSAYGGGELAWFSESAGADAELADRLATNGVTRSEIAERISAQTGRQITASGVGTLIGDHRRSEYCRAVVRDRHPAALDLGDICAVRGEKLPRVAVMWGGFPCQDLSPAGSGMGLDGARSGLWREWVRVLREMPQHHRPDLVIENSARLVASIDAIMADLHELGYSAGWQVIGAVGVGAPHQRNRVIIVALLRRTGEPERLPVWPHLRPIAERMLASWWNPEREPLPRVTAPLSDPDERRHRIMAVAALGNAVVFPVAVAAGMAVRDAVAPKIQGGRPAGLRLFAAPPIGQVTLWGDAPAVYEQPTFPMAGAMWGGRLYEARRIYNQGEAEAMVKAAPLCRLYGALLPAPRRRNDEIVQGDAAALLPTPTVTDFTSNRGGAAGRDGQHEQLTLSGLALRGHLVPTPTSSNNGHYLGGNLTLAGLARSGSLVPTPTKRDNSSGSVDDPDRCATGFRRLNEEAVLLDAGRMLPTPVKTVSTRGDCPGERDRNTPHLGSVGVQLDAAQGAMCPTPRKSDTRSGSVSREVSVQNSRPLCEWATRLGQMLATPTEHGNYNRKGASRHAGDGLATQASMMAVAGGGAKRTLLTVEWTAFLMGVPAAVAPIFRTTNASGAMGDDRG